MTAFRLSSCADMPHGLCQVHGNAMDAEHRHYLFRNPNTEAVSWPQHCPVCAMDAWRRADAMLRQAARELVRVLAHDR